MKKFWFAVLAILPLLALSPFPLDAKVKDHALAKAALAPTYPVRHPKRSLKAMAYGILFAVEAGVDAVRAPVHALDRGLSKLDAALEKLEKRAGGSPRDKTPAATP